MATIDVYTSAADAYLRSANDTYATARTGGGTFTLTTVADTGYVGQWTGYNIGVMYMDFDLGTAIGAGYHVTQFDLKTYLSLDSSTQDFIIETRIYDWGAEVTNADWVAGADVGALSLLAQLDTNGIGATGAYKTHAMEAGAGSLISTTGVLRVILTSSRFRNGDTPAGDEYVGLRMSERTDTSADPYATVTYEADAAGGILNHVHHYHAQQ
jgi:hypothetical protein